MVLCYGSDKKLVQLQCEQCGNPTGSIQRPWATWGKLRRKASPYFNFGDSLEKAQARCCLMKALGREGESIVHFTEKGSWLSIASVCGKQQLTGNLWKGKESRIASWDMWTELKSLNRDKTMMFLFTRSNLTRLGMQSLSSGSWWRTVKPGVLQSVGSQRDKTEQLKNKQISPEFSFNLNVVKYVII